MKLSPHFTLLEMTKSQTASRHGINNQPNEAQIANLRRLTVEILEPVREHFGRAFTPSSGFRSLELNNKLKSKPTSQHTKGEAVDFEIPGIANRDVAEWIRDHLTFDQLILEFHYPSEPSSGWVHVSLKEKNNRCQVLTINREGIWSGLIKQT